MLTLSEISSQPKSGIAEPLGIDPGTRERLLKSRHIGKGCNTYIGRIDVRMRSRVKAEIELLTTQRSRLLTWLARYPE